MQISSPRLGHCSYTHGTLGNHDDLFQETSSSLSAVKTFVKKGIVSQTFIWSCSYTAGKRCRAFWIIRVRQESFPLIFEFEMAFIPAHGAIGVRPFQGTARCSARSGKLEMHTASILRCTNVLFLGYRNV